MPLAMVSPSAPASCYPPVFKTEIEEAQSLSPDLFSSRARRARALRQGPLRQPRRPPARHSQPQAPPTRFYCPVAEPSGAVGFARPQALSVPPLCTAIVAASARLRRSGRAARHRPVVGADLRGTSASGEPVMDRGLARRDRTGRGTADRPPGAPKASRRTAAQTIGSPPGSGSATSCCGYGRKGSKTRSKIILPTRP